MTAFSTYISFRFYFYSYLDFALILIQVLLKFLFGFHFYFYLDSSSTPILIRVLLPFLFESHSQFYFSLIFT